MLMLLCLTVNANGNKIISGPFMQLDKPETTRLLITKHYSHHYLPCYASIEKNYYYLSSEQIMNEYLHLQRIHTDIYVYICSLSTFFFSLFLLCAQTIQITFTPGIAMTKLWRPTVDGTSSKSIAMARYAYRPLSEPLALTAVKSMSTQRPYFRCSSLWNIRVNNRKLLHCNNR